MGGLGPGNGYPVTSGAVSDAPRGASSVDSSGVSRMGEATLPVASTELLERFYRDLLYELGEFARRRTATAVGAAVVTKRVAVAYGVEVASRLPLPRLSMPVPGRVLMGYVEEVSTTSDRSFVACAARRGCRQHGE